MQRIGSSPNEEWCGNILINWFLLRGLHSSFQSVIIRLSIRQDVSASALFDLFFVSDPRYYTPFHTRSIDMAGITNHGHRAIAPQGRSHDLIS